VEKFEINPFPHGTIQTDTDTIEIHFYTSHMGNKAAICFSDEQKNAELGLPFDYFSEGFWKIKNKKTYVIEITYSEFYFAVGQKLVFRKTEDVPS